MEGPWLADGSGSPLCGPPPAPGARRSQSCPLALSRGLLSRAVEWWLRCAGGPARPAGSAPWAEPAPSGRGRLAACRMGLCAHGTCAATREADDPGGSRGAVQVWRCPFRRPGAVVHGRSRWGGQEAECPRPGRPVSCSGGDTGGRVPRVPGPWVSLPALCAPGRQGLASPDLTDGVAEPTEGQCPVRAASVPRVEVGPAQAACPQPSRRLVRLRRTELEPGAWRVHEPRGFSAQQAGVGLLRGEVIPGVCPHVRTVEQVGT